MDDFTLTASLSEDGEVISQSLERISPDRPALDQQYQAEHQHVWLQVISLLTDL